MIVVLPAPVWPTMARVWPGSTRKETSRRTQSSSFGVRAAVIGEPDVAELDFAARRPYRMDGASEATAAIGSSSKLEDAFGGGHGRLQDVEFFAQVLNRPEEALRVLHERDQHADGDRAAE